MTFTSKPSNPLNEASGALLLCGTTSNAGKTTLVAGLCRLLRRNGVSVAPFKAQNMALNSAVTGAGHEIGRAQYLQAQAAEVEADVSMNPVLLKPTGERSSQVVVMGEPVAELSAAEYHRFKPQLVDVVNDALNHLRDSYDVVLCEGAGSAAEINLLEHDLVNLQLARRADMNAVVVGNIDPGGVFASLYGTVKILPDDLARFIRGFIINNLRGDPSLLFDGTTQLESMCGVPTIGVIPHLQNLDLDAEDSLNLTNSIKPGAQLDVAVVRFPRLSNFTDLDPLRAEPNVSVRFVQSPSEVGDPDLFILPGTKSTVEDLAWLRQTGLAERVIRIASKPDTERQATILGICGGYQMLGQHIDDLVESQSGLVDGLNLLNCATKFDTSKVLHRTDGRAFDLPISGYQIHHGRVVDNTNTGWIHIDDPEPQTEGSHQKNVFGTTFHGLFESDEFRTEFLRRVATRSDAIFEPEPVNFGAKREHQLNRLADHLEKHLDLTAIAALLHPPGHPQ